MRRGKGECMPNSQMKDQGQILVEWHPVGRGVVCRVQRSWEGEERNGGMLSVDTSLPLHCLLREEYSPSDRGEYQSTAVSHLSIRLGPVRGCSIETRREKSL